MTNNNSMFKNLLIALVVIGIIAALTVPALMQKTQKQEYVTALKKAYSTLSQVTQEIIAEKGSPKGWQSKGSYEDKQYIKLQK